MNFEWLRKLNQVISDGKLTSPRGIDTLEIIGGQFVLPSMMTPVLTVPYRNLGYRFAAAEAWWILSGSNKLKDIVPFAKNMAKYSDDGIHLNGAYGPKIVDQIPYVVKCLKRDNNSRQAVINIWRERPGLSKDIPCTLSMQFLLREGILHTIVSMRSSDIWMGLPYDTFSFSMVSAYIASMLRDYCYRLGSLTITAGSQHLYTTNEDAAKHIVDCYIKYSAQDWNKSTAILDDWVFTDTPSQIIERLENAAVVEDGSGVLEMCK
jgi:thymidylate synthase